MNITNVIKKYIPVTYRKIETINVILQNKIDSLQSKTDILQNKIDSLQSKTDILQNKMDNLQSKTDILQNKMDNLSKPLIDFIHFSEILFEAKKVHEKVFPKYKNIFRGKDVAIIGCGPTLDKWVPDENFIKMGVNSTIFSEKFNLDFLFIQDYNNSLFSAIKATLKDKNCKVFTGIHYLSHVKTIPSFEIEELNAEPYYFYDLLQTDFFPWTFSLDISEKPFILYYSTIFIPLQFALYTHPKRIFIVGCDCSSDGHFSKNFENCSLQEGHCKGIIEGWKKFKDFASRFYPEIEIISINPVGLKGLFTDIYQ